MQRGEWEHAESLLGQAVETCPTNSDSRRYYAETLWHRGAREAAIEQIGAAVADGATPQTVVRAGEMLLATAQVDAALAHAEEALNHDPTLASAWTLRGRVMRTTGRLDRALADHYRALDFAPNDVAVLLEVAELHQMRSQPQQVLTTVQHLLDLYPPGEESPQALYQQGLAQSQLRRDHDAVESFAAAARHDDSNVELLFQLGRAQLMTGKTTAAAANLRRVITLDADHQPSIALLAKMRENGQFGTLVGLQPSETQVR
jgi:tetratricopeptide (TPR) repeat protein